MKRLTQTLQYDEDHRFELQALLKDWHKQHPFRSGADFEFEYVWVEMTDEDAFAFSLKHPQFSHRFKDV